MNDFLEGCWVDVDPGRKDRPTFMQTFCARCRNPECVHAKKANDSFTRRVTTQVDRLFNPPERTDNKEPRYAMLSDFVDVSEMADKIELFSSRGEKAVVPPNPEKTEKADWRDRYIGPQDEPLEEALELPEPESTEPEPVAPRVTPSMIIKPGNTPVPSGGIILPGAPLAKVPSVQQPAVDPWAIPAKGTVKVVERGATVKMGEP